MLFLLSCPCISRSCSCCLWLGPPLPLSFLVVICSCCVVFSCSVVRRLLAVFLFHPGSVCAKSFSVVSPFLPTFIVAFAVCGMAVSISLLQCQSKAFSHGVHSSTRLAPLLLLPLLHLVSVSLRSSVLTLSSLASSRSFRYRVVVPYVFACRGS